MTKLALITGASSGIGKEMARIHAEHGGNLILVARNQERLTNLKQELETKYKIKAEVIVKDLMQASAAAELYDEIKQRQLRVDYLINNAGLGGMGTVNERKVEDDLAMIQLNVSTLVTLSHYFVKEFTQRNSGRILQVSSTASLVPGPQQAVYYATKAFASSFSNGLSGELLGTNVTVTNLMPGATETEFGQISGMDKTELFKKPASARQVASDGYRGMLKGKIDVISGLPSSQKLLLKLSKFMPKSFVIKLVGKMQETKK